jgi:hypothetical protein
MFVVVSIYQAKVGEEDAIVALHEDWQRCQMHGGERYLSWELLRKIESPREFITIAHFASEELAQAAEAELERDAWFSRLMSLVEVGSMRTECTSEWILPKPCGPALARGHD